MSVPTQLIEIDHPTVDDELSARVADDLGTAGWTVLRGVERAWTPEAMGEFVAALLGAPLEYTERSSPRSALGARVYTSTEFPADQEIQLHNENSYQADWPMRLAFFCLQPADYGGATPLADTRTVLESMDQGLAQRFRELGWMVRRNFHEHLGVSWEEAFGTTDCDQVVAYCAAHDMRATWHGDVLRTEATRPAIRTHPVTGDDVWFNHATVFHVESQPATTREGLRELFTDDELPTNSYLGDGSPISREDIIHLQDCYARARFRFDYARGDVLVIDNMLVAHGREPFTGDRSIAVAMARPYSQEQRTDG